MSYLVIARRFRPQTFASIVGQEHISRALANAIIRNRIAHALLFTGPRGVGKTTTARVLARALNCTGRDLSKASTMSEDEAREYVEPCGACPNCLEIAKGTSLACREIDGASNNSVENVRELIESLRTLPPPGSNYKIYLIDEVHMLSTAAFNALLKSLEEPPPHTIFIFATTDPQKIPETVISRCQQFDFRRLPREVVMDNLKKIAQSEKVKIDDDVFRLIARKAQGGMRDAQSLLDRLLAFSEKEVSLSFAQEVFGVADGRVLTRLADAILNGGSGEALEILNELFQRSLDIRGFVSDFIGFFRALFLISLPEFKGEGVLDLDRETASEIKALLEGKESFDLQRLYRLAQETADQALTSSFPRYVLEAGIARMAALPSLRPLAQILASVEDTPILKKTANTVSIRKEAPRSTETQSAAVDSFNPEWQDFVHHCKSSGFPLLAQFLRRITARKFQDGKLGIEGSSFDIQHLKDPTTMDSLKKALQSYASAFKWEVSLHESAGVPSQAAAHSLAAKEEDAKRLKNEQVNRDVREDPIVQAALSTFQGSKIDRISVLKNS